MPLVAKKEVSHDYFWDSDNDRYYNANSMSDWLLPFFQNGVFNGQMQVTANNDMSVTVAAGYGYINGKHRHFVTATKIDLETASGTLHRIDNVVIRRNDTNRAITLEIVKGGNSSNPVAPALTRTGTIYELKLAEIYIAAGTVAITQAEITDTRMNAAVCGWVCATVKQIDFTQIQAQFDAYFTAYKKNISDQYQVFLQNMKEYRDQGEAALALMKQTFEQYAADQEQLYETWIQNQESNFEEWSGGQQDAFALWRQNQEQAFNNWYMTNTNNWTEQFTEWFQNIKDILSGDVAGKLQNEIEVIQNIIETGRIPSELITKDGDQLITVGGDQLISFCMIKTSENCNCNP